MRSSTRLTSLTVALILLITACGPKTQPSVQFAPAATETATSSAKPIPTSDVQKSVFTVKTDSPESPAYLLLIDPYTGEKLPNYEPVKLGMAFFSAFAPDHQTIALVGYPSNMNPYKPTLYVVNSPKWPERTLELNVTGWVDNMAFSPDGSQLAITMCANDLNCNLVLVDAKRNELRGLKPIDYLTRALKFTADGSALMVYGRRQDPKTGLSLGAPKAELLSTTDLNLLWSIDLTKVKEGFEPGPNFKGSAYEPDAGTEYWPAVVFSPQKDMLYIVHADEEKLSQVDFASQKITTVAIHPKLSLLEQFLMLGTEIVHAKGQNGVDKEAVISPDGKTLYVIGIQNTFTKSSLGEWQFDQTPLGLQGIDTTDGTQLFIVDTKATDLTLTPDGKWILAHRWEENGTPWTDLFDVEQGKFTTSLENADAFLVLQQDGSPLLLSAITRNGTTSHVKAYPLSGETLAQWDSIGNIFWLSEP